jgi:DNA-binding transcriptional LysR family regulator
MFSCNDTGTDMALPINEHVGRRLTVRELRVICTVIQCRGVSKAASVLHTTQPAVSRTIAQLERLLGVRLFDRLARGIEPTAFGLALRDCGVAVFDELRRGVEQLEHLADPSAGGLRIGCNPFLAASFVPAIIDRVRRAHPRVVFELVVAPSASLHRELAERNVDLLVTRSPGEAADEHGRFEPLFDDSFVVVAGDLHPLARRRRLTLDALADEAWVLPPAESTIGKVARSAFHARGLPAPRVAVVAVPLETKVALLQTGRFLTIFPSSAIRMPKPRSGLRVLPVDLAVAAVANGVLVPRDRTLGPLAQMFIEAARSTARKVPGARR